MIAPPSKSYTHRAYLTALTNGGGIIRNPLRSDDTDTTLKIINSFSSEFNDHGDSVEIIVNQPLKIIEEELFVRESGTLLRFLLPLVSVLPGPDEVVLKGEKTLKNRSNREPVESLRQAGLNVQSTSSKHTIPITCFPGQILDDNKVQVACETTSQFLSGWLITMSSIGGGTVERTTELVSAPYVTMTERVLSEAGVAVEHTSEENYEIRPERSGEFNYKVPGDYSSSAFLILAGILTKGPLVVEGLIPDDPQGDSKIVDLIDNLGVDIKWESTAPGLPPDLILPGGLEPEPFELDASNCPDLVPALSVLAALANGESKIVNVSHLKNKESDRLNRTAEELRKFGPEVRTSENDLIVQGDPSLKRDGGRIEVHSHGDHRLAMAFSILALVRGNVIIRNANCVKKSYPNFYDDLSKLEVELNRSGPES